MADQIESQPQQEEAPGQNFETGSEDAAILALSQKHQPEVEDESTETPEDEPEEEAEAEPEEGETDDAEAEDELVEVEYEGKTYKVQPQIAPAVLRQSDYSRKMNEVGAKEKEFTQRLEQIEVLDKTAEQRVEVLAEIKSLDEQIKQYEGIDWAKAKSETPAEAAMAAVELMSLKQARQEAAGKQADIERTFGDKRNALLNQKRDDMVKALAKDLPGWGEELGTKITKHAISKGWTPQELSQVTDPKVVIALDAQRKYEAAQQGKAALKTKVQNAPPVVKPGARVPVVSKADTSMARFKQSKSEEDAIAALNSRSKQR
jgi:hypothetical protein